MEKCADCGKPISMGEPSYYRPALHGDFGQSFHSHCGDPLGMKAKDARLADLDAEVQRLRRVVVQYGDRARMSNAADMELQQAIDRAFEAVRT